jgi:hypothetical protein
MPRRHRLDPRRNALRGGRSAALAASAQAPPGLFAAGGRGRSAVSVSAGIAPRHPRALGLGGLLAQLRRSPPPSPRRGATQLPAPARSARRGRSRPRRLSSSWRSPGRAEVADAPTASSGRCPSPSRQPALACSGRRPRRAALLDRGAALSLLDRPRPAATRGYGQPLLAAPTRPRDRAAPATSTARSSASSTTSFAVRSAASPGLQRPQTQQLRVRRQRSVRFSRVRSSFS